MINLQDFIENNPQEFEQFKVNDVLFVEYHCIIEEVKSGFWTPNNYFFYILSGRKKWESQAREYTGKANDAFFIKKGAYVTHQYFEEDFCALLIFLPDDFIKHVIEKHQIKSSQPEPEVSPDFVFPLNVDDILSTYFQSVYQYFSRQNPPPIELLKVKFEELLIYILSDSENQHICNFFYRICSQNKISIPEIMEANFTFNMNLEEFAKLCGRSLSTFNRDFREIYNTTPGKWLTQKRLEYSKHLLKMDNRSISEVAFDSGFESSSHYIRVFKQNFGVTPLNFKKQHSFPG